MKIAISGGTGFVGRALTKELLRLGHDVYVLTRKPPQEKSGKKLTFVEWMSPGANPAALLEGVDFFINLAGESISSGRWTKERKKRILESRMTTTEEVLRILEILEKKPKALINASAIGYYGTSLSSTFTEADMTSGNDFLAQTTASWEKAALEVEKLGVRTVLMRFGIILGRDGGALPQMVLPYTFFAGGTIGSGKQWVSWIHIEDVVRAIIFSMENEKIFGPVNFTAPQPVTMKKFGKTIGKVLRRPHWFPVPSFFMRLAMGEMSLLVVEGQRVLPKKLLHAGFQFSYEKIEDALGNIFNSK